MHSPCNSLDLHLVCGQDLDCERHYNVLILIKYGTDLMNTNTHLHHDLEKGGFEFLSHRQKANLLFLSVAVRDCLKGDEKKS